jgi:hypothetical protein
MGKPIIWSGTNAKLINAGDLVDRNGNSLTNGAKVDYTWTSHGLSEPADIGRPVYVVSGTQLALADNTLAANAEVVGFIYDVLDANTLRISFGGNCPAVGSNVLEGGGSLTAGTVYFLAATAGKITATEPTTIGYISKPLAVATGTASLMFINYRGSTVGSTNARTQINLSNNSTTNMQNCASYDAGSIEGWIYIDATTDYRFYFNAPFAEKGTNNDYFISPSYVGDTPPAGFSITINSSGQSIITLPNISGFVSATCTYSLNAPAVGTNFPLALDSANLTNSGITGLTGTAATTAVTSGSGKVGEKKEVTFDFNPTVSATYSTSSALSITAGIWLMTATVYSSTAASLQSARIGISTDSTATTFNDLTLTPNNFANCVVGTLAGSEASASITQSYNISSTTNYYAKVVTTGAGSRCRGQLTAIRIA